MEQNITLTDKDIALSLMASSKTGITSLAKVLTETTNSQVRETLKSQLTDCVSSHHRLSDMAISKGWYNASQDPQQQLQSELANINSISQ